MNGMKQIKDRMDMSSSPSSSSNESTNDESVGGGGKSSCMDDRPVDNSQQINFPLLRKDGGLLSHEEENQEPDSSSLGGKNLPDHMVIDTITIHDVILNDTTQLDTTPAYQNWLSYVSKECDLTTRMNELDAGLLVFNFKAMYQQLQPRILYQDDDSTTTTNQYHLATMKQVIQFVYSLKHYHEEEIDDCMVVLNPTAELTLRRYQANGEVTWMNKFLGSKKYITEEEAEQKIIQFESMPVVHTKKKKKKQSSSATMTTNTPMPKVLYYVGNGLYRHAYPKEVQEYVANTILSESTSTATVPPYDAIINHSNPNKTEGQLRWCQMYRGETRTKITPQVAFEYLQNFQQPRVCQDGPVVHPRLLVSKNKILRTPTVQEIISNVNSKRHDNFRTSSQTTLLDKILEYEAKLQDWEWNAVARATPTGGSVAVATCPTMSSPDVVMIAATPTTTNAPSRIGSMTKRTISYHEYREPAQEFQKLLDYLRSWPYARDCMSDLKSNTDNMEPHVITNAHYDTIRKAWKALTNSNSTGDDDVGNGNRNNDAGSKSGERGGGTCNKKRKTGGGSGGGGHGGQGGNGSMFNPGRGVMTTTMGCAMNVTMDGMDDNETDMDHSLEDEEDGSCHTDSSCGGDWGSGSWSDDDGSDDDDHDNDSKYNNNDEGLCFKQDVAVPAAEVCCSFHAREWSDEQLNDNPTGVGHVVKVPDTCNQVEESNHGMKEAIQEEEKEEKEEVVAVDRDSTTKSLPPRHEAQLDAGATISTARTSATISGNPSNDRTRTQVPLEDSEHDSSSSSSGVIVNEDDLLGKELAKLHLSVPPTSNQDSTKQESEKDDISKASKMSLTKVLPLVKVARSEGGVRDTHRLPLKSSMRYPGDQYYSSTTMDTKHPDIQKRKKKVHYDDSTVITGSTQSSRSTEPTVASTVTDPASTTSTISTLTDPATVERMFKEMKDEIDKDQEKYNMLLQELQEVKESAQRSKNRHAEEFQKAQESAKKYKKKLITIKAQNDQLRQDKKMLQEEKEYLMLENERLKSSQIGEATS